MKNKDSNKIKIDNVLKDKPLKITYSPIVSVIKGKVIGFNGRYEGADLNDEFVDISTLSKAAAAQNVSIELDRLYREKTVENFVGIYSKNNEMLIFVKINISLIAEFVGSGIIMNLIEKYQIDPGNVVLDIIGDNIEDVESLKEFINLYRSKGFLIAISGIGSGLSNLDKISYVEPDIVKISPAIVEDILVDYYKQEIFKALINLCKNIGALVVADGIVDEQQALLVMELGADMLQGEYFMSCDNITYNYIKEIKVALNHIAKEYKVYTHNKIFEEKSKYKQYDTVLTSILKDFSHNVEENFNDFLQNAVKNNSMFECVYILNEEGIQISETVTEYNMLGQKALIFKPAERGTDHSLKKYYYFLKDMMLEKYITEPYISLATGNLCVTMSSVFEDKENKKYILCIDFNPNHIGI